MTNLTRRTTWKAPVTVALGLLLALASCTRDPQREAPKKALTPDSAPQAPKGVKLRLPSIHDQMKKITQFTEEMRRRVRGNVGTAGPAKVVRATLKTVPVHRYPKSFKMFYDGMLVRTEAMITSKNPGRDYNLLVDRCVACHALHAQGYLGLVKRLKLPEDQLPKGPPPSLVKPTRPKLEIPGRPTGKPAAPRSK